MADLAWDAEEEGLCALPIRVVKPIDWERDAAKDAVRLRMERSQRDTWYRPVVVPILEGLERGATLPVLVRDLVAAGSSRETAVRLVRSFVHGLAAEGSVRVDLPAGPAVLRGRYERVRELGRGAVGVAWLFRDRERDGAPVVVKHAWNWTGPLPERDAHVREEAAVLARVEHPNVVGLVDAFDDGGLAHVVRDYLAGEELATLVLREGPGAPAERTRRLATIAGVLAHLHRRGVLCLDLNPSNFMAREGGDPADVVLVDLGHCKAVDEHGGVRVAGAWGARRYRPPESPGVLTPASDVYSLGRLAAFLALGRSPPVDADAGAVAEAVRAAGGSDVEARIVASACAPRAEDRPALDEVAAWLATA